MAPFLQASFEYVSLGVYVCSLVYELLVIEHNEHK